MIHDSENDIQNNLDVLSYGVCGHSFGFEWMLGAAERALREGSAPATSVRERSLPLFVGKLCYDRRGTTRRIQANN